MNKRNLLFKLLEGIVLLLIGYKILQVLVRIYAIITLTRVVDGNGLIKTQFPYIMRELKIEYLINNIIVVSFLIMLSTWFYIKYVNAHRVSRLQLTYKPIWALFAFLISFFNLVAPYKIMNELWTVQNRDMSIDHNGKIIIKTWCILSVMIVIASRYLSIQANQVEGLKAFLTFEYYYLFFYLVSLHYFLETRKLVKMIGA